MIRTEKVAARLIWLVNWKNWNCFKWNWNKKNGSGTAIEKLKLKKQMFMEEIGAWDQKK